MDFAVETEKITTNTIDKFIDILLSMISPVRANKCLLQILLTKMHEVFVYFNEKFKISFPQIVYMLWMIMGVNKTLQYRPELSGMSPFTILSYLHSSFINSFKFLFDVPFSFKSFSNLINPNVMKLVKNERLVLYLLKYDLHPSELEFALYKNLLI
jgi:hypothetical protein